MSEAMKVVSISPDVMSETPVFAGTRVPIRNFIDDLEAGESLDEFLNDFPTVSREQAVDALELAGECLIAHAAAS